MIVHRNIIKDLGRILFWYPFRWCVNILPPSSVHWMGKVMGDLDFAFAGSGRINNIAMNISRVLKLDKNELTQMVREIMRNHCRNNLEFIRYPGLNRRNMSKVMDFEGLEILDNALAGGKGVMLLTAHFGAKQLLQVGFGHLGYKLNQICYHMSHEELSFVQKNVAQRQRIKIEEKIPANFIPSNQFMRSAYKCLKDNEILVVAADGIGLPEHMNKGYDTFSFLGETVYFPSNVLSLAKKTGSSVIPCFVVREGIEHKIVIEQPIDISFSIEDAYKEYLKKLESYIRTYPVQWEFWEEFREGILIEQKKKVVQ